MSDQSRQCGKCRFWERLPTDPANLANIQGECRHGPPQTTAIPTNRGLQIHCGYPILPLSFPGCHQIERRIVDPSELTLLGEKAASA